MPDEIKEFVSNTLKQIKEAVPTDCDLEGRFDFDISVVATKEKSGKIDLKIVEGNLAGSTQQVHRIRFAVFDKASQRKNVQRGINDIRRFLIELVPYADSLGIPEPKTRRRT